MQPPTFEPRLRRAHLWLGTIAGLQLLAWTLGGLVFTLQPIDDVRGSHLVQPAQDLIAGPELLSPVAANPRWATVPLQAIRLLQRPDGPAWVLGRTAIDANTGAALPALDAERARQVVQQRTGLPVLEVVELTDVALDHEARGMPLPVWQLTLDHDESPRAYVDQVTGRLLAVRTTTWRVFDFMWMLHVMDYEEREVFWHWLIRVFAVLGLASVLSGLVLMVTVHRRRWRKRRQASAANTTTQPGSG